MKIILTWQEVALAAQVGVRRPPAYFVPDRALLALDQLMEMINGRQTGARAGL